MEFPGLIHTLHLEDGTMPGHQGGIWHPSVMNPNALVEQADMGGSVMLVVSECSCAHRSVDKLSVF